jgi:hypothetical protein
MARRNVSKQYASLLVLIPCAEFTPCLLNKFTRGIRMPDHPDYPDHLSYIIDITRLMVIAIDQHKIFSALTSIERFRRFTEMHVYATWDFMCLLKALHGKLNASSELLWLPPVQNYGVWLINPRLAIEENDVTPKGDYFSHFEIYLQAMEQCGADTRRINAFIRYVERDPPLSLLLAQNYLPETIRGYLTDTFDMIINKDIHVLAACFAFAHEHIAENRFTQILQRLAPLAAVHSDSLSLFIYYFQRQIDINVGNNMRSEFLLETLCGKDELKWEDAMEAAVLSLKSQLHLLDGIYDYVIG